MWNKELLTALATALFRKAHLKKTQVAADDVEYLQLEWQDSRFKGWYCIKCKKGTYDDVNYPVTELGETKRMKLQISLTQFPIVRSKILDLNHATTGHKLQGKSLNALVIAQWSNVKNWVLVVLSRVRE